MLASLTIGAGWSWPRPSHRERASDNRRTRELRRTELAAFLRSRRGRLAPEDAGLPAGRRRISGLRREEVAQLAGVGATWYTWLEQGRPIHASPQVLDAVARTLRLDPVERQHLFRLAEAPGLADAAMPMTRAPRCLPRSARYWTISSPYPPA